MEYTLSLALFDFLLVLFAGVGFSYIIRLVSYLLPSQGTVAFGEVLWRSWEDFPGRYGSWRWPYRQGA
jgi:hypothetical protein